MRQPFRKRSFFFARQSFFRPTSFIVQQPICFVHGLYFTEIKKDKQKKIEQRKHKKKNENRNGQTNMSGQVLRRNTIPQEEVNAGWKKKNIVAWKCTLRPNM